MLTLLAASLMTWNMTVMSVTAFLCSLVGFYGSKDIRTNTRAGCFLVEHHALIMIDAVCSISSIFVTYTQHVLVGNMTVSLLHLMHTFVAPYTLCVLDTVSRLFVMQIREAAAEMRILVLEKKKCRQNAPTYPDVRTSTASDTHSTVRHLKIYKTSVWVMPCDSAL